MTVRSARTANVVITRSTEGNEELARKLKLVGLNPIPIDAIEVAPPTNWKVVDRLLTRLGTFDWVVFTSASGVKYFGMRMKALSLRLPWKGRPQVAAVGGQTADVLSKLGVKPDFVPSSYLTKVLANELPVEQGARVLLLRADIADHRLAERLDERGFRVEEATIYRTLVGKGPGGRIKDADLIVFASSSAVRGLCELVPNEELAALKRLRAVCIGPVTESAAREKGFENTTTPKSYTLDAAVREVVRLTHEDA